MNNLLTLDVFRKRLRAGETVDQILGPVGARTGKLIAPIGKLDAVAQVDGEAPFRGVRFTISSAAVDRATDTVAVEGWKLDNYLRNPVVLWSHDASIPAIGRSQDTAIEDGVLRSTAVFAPREVHPLADTVYQLITLGMLNTCSVGFQPLTWDYPDSEHEEDRPWGVDFTTQELLEFSICNIPCNPECLVVGRAAGVDTDPLLKWAEGLLDTGGLTAIARKDLEALRRAARMPGGRRRDASPALTTTDPASGGAAVGYCGRGTDHACGMSDPQECSTHRKEDDPMDPEKMAKLVALSVRESLKVLLPDAVKTALAAQGFKGGKPPKTRAEGDEDPDSQAEGGEGGEGEPDGDEVQRSIRRASMHFKAAADALEIVGGHHANGQTEIENALKAKSEDPDASSEGGDGDPEAEERLHAALARKAAAGL